MNEGEDALKPHAPWQGKLVQRLPVSPAHLEKEVAACWLGGDGSEEWV